MSPALAYFLRFLSLALGLATTPSHAAVGPDYQRPPTETPPAYKAADLGDWKTGEPLDHLPKGPWWQVFSDPELDALEEKARLANQDLRAAFAVLEQARATARVARSEFFPSLDLNPRYGRQRLSPTQEPAFGALTADTFTVPLDLSYEIDLWGRVRRGFEGARADADSRAAALQNVLLTLQADVAQNYFAIRTLDTEIAVLHRTIQLRRDQLRIVSGRLESGIGSELDVARAETELATAESDLAAASRRRNELENALAVLAGESPSTFRLPARFPTPPNGTQADDPALSWLPSPPTVPAGLPSQLLERRPDIAEAERQLAADNARIGVAKAAFFPVLRLTGSGGFLSADVESLFNWESRVWSLGPSLSLPIFAGGRNRAGLRRSQARFEESVARYRQRILVAFAEVENALAGIRWLDEQAAAQDRAITHSRRARDLALESFTIGLGEYLDVIDADRAALQNQRARTQLAGQRLAATVQLIKALGGGWQTPASQVPDTTTRATHHSQPAS